MANGALYGSICYDTNAKALDAYYSGVGPTRSAGPTSYVMQYIKDASGWKVKTSSIDSSGFIAPMYEVPAPVLAFPVCDTTESFFDGMTLGWGVAAAMIIAWCVANMRRGL